MRFARYRFIIGFLIVPLVLYLVFVIWPYVQTIQISLTDWSGMTSGFDYVGFSNYTKMVHDPLFWQALWHNVLMLILLPVVIIAIALFLSFMINVGGRVKVGRVAQGVGGSTFYKIVFFFPQVLSIAIIAVLFQNVYESNNGGLINGLFNDLGLHWQSLFLGDPDLALWLVMTVMIWSNVGFFVVLFSAAIGAIPREIYEAVTLDGAGRFGTFFKVTLPLMMDTVQTGWVYMGVLAMDGFALTQIMTIGPGGPNNSTYVLPLYIYNSAFRDSQFGYASAMGVAALVVTLLFAALTFRFTRRDRIEF